MLAELAFERAPSNGLAAPQAPVARHLHWAPDLITSPHLHPPLPLRSTLDWMLGYFLFAFLFLLSFLFVFDKIQGALLFNMKFAKALEVRHGTLNTGARRHASCAVRVMATLCDASQQEVGPLVQAVRRRTRAARTLLSWRSATRPSPAPSVHPPHCCSARACWRPTTSPPTSTALRSAPRRRSRRCGGRAGSGVCNHRVWVWQGRGCSPG